MQKVTTLSFTQIGPNPELNGVDEVATAVPPELVESATFWHHTLWLKAQEVEKLADDFRFNKFHLYENITRKEQPTFTSVIELFFNEAECID